MDWVTRLRAGSGNTVIAFAMGAAPLSLVTGLMIEYGRISAARFEAEAALSAAVWTAASQPEADPAFIRQAFFDRRALDSVYAVNNLVFEQDANGDMVGTATIALPTGIMSLTGLVPEETVIRIRVPLQARPNTRTAKAAPGP
jgi:Flp pilus assembly protein TadG